MEVMRLASGKCKGEVVYPPGKSSRLAENCPHCNVEWQDHRFQNDRDVQEMISLMVSVNFLSNAPKRKDALPFSARFELQGEE